MAMTSLLYFMIQCQVYVHGNRKTDLFREALSNTNDIYIKHGDEIVLYNPATKKTLIALNQQSWKAECGAAHSSTHAIDDTDFLLNRLYDEGIGIQHNMFLTHIIEKTNGNNVKIGDKIYHNDTIQLKIKRGYEPEILARKHGAIYLHAQWPCHYCVGKDDLGFQVFTNDGKELKHSSEFELWHPVYKSHRIFIRKDAVKRSDSNAEKESDIVSNEPSDNRQKWMVLITGYTLDALIFDYLNKQINTKEQSLTDVTNEKNQLSQQLNHVNTNLALTQSQLNACEANKNILEKQLNDKGMEHGMLENELKQKVLEMEQNISIISTQLDVCHANETALTQELYVYQQNVSILNAKMDEMDIEKSKMLDQINKTNEFNKVSISQLKECNQNCSFLSVQLLHAHQAIAKMVENTTEITNGLHDQINELRFSKTKNEKNDNAGNNNNNKEVIYGTAGIGIGIISIIIVLIIFNICKRLRDVSTIKISQIQKEGHMSPTLANVRLHSILQNKPKIALKNQKKTFENQTCQENDNENERVTNMATNAFSNLGECESESDELCKYESSKDDIINDLYNTRGESDIQNNEEMDIINKVISGEIRPSFQVNTPR